MYLEYFSHRSDITEPKSGLPKVKIFTIKHKIFNFLQLLMRTVARDFGRTGLHSTVIQLLLVIGGVEVFMNCRYLDTILAVFIKQFHYFHFLQQNPGPGAAKRQKMEDVRSPPCKKPRAQRCILHRTDVEHGKFIPFSRTKGCTPPGASYIPARC